MQERRSTCVSLSGVWCLLQMREASKNLPPVSKGTIGMYQTKSQKVILIELNGKFTIFLQLHIACLV